MIPAWLKKLGLAIVVWIVVAIVVWLIGALLVASGVDTPTHIGNFLENAAGLIGFLCGIIYFFRGNI